MNILLTNDDGYNSIGIRLLKEKLQSYGNVIICAPKEHMSAKSCSITLGKGIEVIEEEKNVFSIGGTPADCVSFALSSLNIKFDLVVSGCNDGWNVSWDTLFSGTIGACSQSLILGVPAIAFSCEHNFHIVERYFCDVMNFILNNDLLSKEYILNVNYPLGDKVKDIKLSTIHYRNDDLWFEKRIDGYYALRNIDETKPKTNTDWYLIHHQCVSITPLGKTLGDNDIFNTIKLKK